MWKTGRSTVVDLHVLLSGSSGSTLIVATAGTGDRPYTESSYPNPHDVNGCTPALYRRRWLCNMDAFCFASPTTAPSTAHRCI